MNCDCLKRNDGIGAMHGFHDELCPMRCAATIRVKVGWFRRKTIRCELEIGHRVTSNICTATLALHHSHSSDSWDSEVTWA
jgi:hypothetical protein